MGDGTGGANSAAAAGGDTSAGRLHSCPWAGCKRAYKRLDHLERHQKTHTGQLNFRCHYCAKSYSRSDVLNRHLVQTHGAKAARAGRPRRAACMGCVDEHVACDGVPPKTCSRCREQSRVCRYRHLELEAQTKHTGQDSASPEQNIKPMVDTPLSIPKSLSDSHEQALGLSSDPVMSRPMSGFQGIGLAALGDAAEAQSRYEASPPSLNASTSTTMPWQGSVGVDDHDSMAWLTEFLLKATATPDNLLPWGFDAPTTQTQFEWGFNDFDMNIFGPIATRPPSPVMQPGPAPGREQDVRVAIEAEEMEGKSLPDGQPSDSAWPTMYKPRSAELAINMPASSSTVASPTSSSRGMVKTSQRKTMENLIMHAHNPIWSRPDTTNFPSESTLTFLVNLYLQHFSPWLPLVDSPPGSFRIDKAASITVKAMAAIGAVYARDGLERLALPLAELVRREIVFICEHDQRFIYEPGVVQAALLQTVYGVFSGSPKLFRQAEICLRGLVASSTGMHLFDARVSAAAHASRTGYSEAEMPRAIVQDHRRRRLAWGIFLIDAQLHVLFGVPSQVPLNEILCPLPTVSPDRNPEQIEFAQIMSTLLEKGELLAQPLDDIGYSCLAYGVFRLCLDAASLQTFARSRSTRFKYTLPTPGYDLHPQSILDQLASHTLKNNPVPSDLLVSCSALAHHAHIQFTELGLLEQVKIAAGRSGDISSQADARRGLASWLNGHRAAARNVFANAAMLYCLMSKFPFDTPPELVWTFDAALCMWAALRFSDIMFSPDSLIPPSPTQSTPKVVISWQPSPMVDGWIEHGGGEVAVEGLGGGAHLTPLTSRTVLQSAAAKLDNQSWGMAARYRQVLLSLVQEETAGGGANA